MVSPGFAPHPLAAGLDVYSEPELAWRLRRPGDPPWLEVTRANGKTTTTTMLAAILTAAWLRTAAIGNIGEPLVDLAGGHDVLAVELSSFQLRWSRRLAPAAECCSISPMTTWSGMAASPPTPTPRPPSGAPPRDPATIMSKRG